MTGVSDPLDFEFEDPIQISPSITQKKKKVIGLDDLLVDYYKEQNKIIEKEPKRTKVKKKYDSESDEDDREAKLSECVDRCQNQMGQIGGDDEMPLWGIQVFGDQKPSPPPVSPELLSCSLFQSFISHDINSLVELQSEEGEIFLEGLLIDGWLIKIVQTCKKLEKSIARWTFNLMLYSSSDMLSTAAYNFWNALLSPKIETDHQRIQIDWLPCYSELIRALELYGFLWDSASTSSRNVDMIHADSDSDNVGPSQNIRSWIKFVAAFCRARSAHLIFSTSEVEEILFVISCLFLDRQLLGLSGILCECLVSAIGFFKDDEWRSSSVRIAKSLACRLPRDINCLRTVESISGVDARNKHLRSMLAFQFLVACFDNQADDPEEVLRLLMSINLREKNCDLLKMYIYIGLAENWLSCNSMLKDKPVINEMWTLCLRNCASQISSADLRAFALKLRSKALYILQGDASR